MIFHKDHTTIRHFASGGFTLVEAAVAITLIGVSVAATMGALTKFNSFAAMSRNSTGAATVLVNQVDLFQSMSPFNPQKTNADGTTQIPKYTEANNNPQNLPTYDMTVGTHPLGYKDPSTGVVSPDWPVYRDPVGGIIVKGTMTCTVTSLSSAPYLYQAVFTVTYTYLNRNYSYSMSAIRTSDI